MQVIILFYFISFHLFVCLFVCLFVVVVIIIIVIIILHQNKMNGLLREKNEWIKLMYMQILC